MNTKMNKPSSTPGQRPYPDPFWTYTSPDAQVSQPGMPQSPSQRPGISGLPGGPALSQPSMPNGHHQNTPANSAIGVGNSSLASLSPPPSRFSPPIPLWSSFYNLPHKTVLILVVASVLLGILGSLSLGRQVFQEHTAMSTPTAVVTTRAGNNKVPTIKTPAVWPVVSPTTQPTPTVAMITPTMAVATPTVAPNVPVPGTVLGQDTFSRSDQMFWGTASDGQTWQGDAANSPLYSVSQRVGLVTGSTGGGYSNALLGPVTKDESIVVSGLVTDFQNDSLGVLLRWVDPNNWYKAYINGTQLAIEKRVNNQVIVLASTQLPLAAKVPYSIRFNAQGPNLSLRVWLTGLDEPTTWALTVKDTSFTAGLGGIRVGLQAGTQAYVLSFQEWSL